MQELMNQYNIQSVAAKHFERKYPYVESRMECWEMRGQNGEYFIGREEKPEERQRLKLHEHSKSVTVII